MGRAAPVAWLERQSVWSVPLSRRNRVVWSSREEGAYRAYATDESRRRRGEQTTREPAIMVRPKLIGALGLLGYIRIDKNSGL